MTEAPAAGLVGFGATARVHAAALADVGVPIAGVVGSSPAAGARAARELRTRAFPSLTELLADDAIDVVHICTPNHLHVSQAHEALRAGKHVVCEKPLGLDHETALGLAEAAEHSGLVHAVCYVMRFAGGIAALRRAVAQGELGELHLVDGAFHLDEVDGLADGHWMLDPARAGGSLTLADIGVHWWDAVEHLTGERVVEGIAATRSLRAGGLDDSAVICLRLTGGVHAVGSLSQVAGGAQRLAVELCGTRAAAAWEGAELVGADGAEGARRAAFGDLLRSVYAEVAAGRRSDSPAYPTFHDGARGMAVLDALLASVKTGRWERVEGKAVQGG